MKNQTNHEKWEREFKEWANKAFPQSHPQINAMQLGWVAAKAHEAKKSTWISVDDRLPESGQCVFAYPGENLDVFVSVFSQTRGFSAAHPLLKVTHWQPIPMPPKGNE